MDVDVDQDPVEAVYRPVVWRRAGSFHTAPIRAPKSPSRPYGSGMGAVEETSHL